MNPLGKILTSDPLEIAHEIRAAIDLVAAF